jgi:hypothetical protein
MGLVRIALTTNFVYEKNYPIQIINANIFIFDITNTHCYI